jgi:hypothetical protein
MSGKKAFVPLAIIVAASVLGSITAAWSSFGGDPVNETLQVIPCSLDVKGYGFVKSRDGAWEVETNCGRQAAPDDPASPRTDRVLGTRCAASHRGCHRPPVVPSRGM